jgi:hypothetical protein
MPLCPDSITFASERGVRQMLCSKMERGFAVKKDAAFTLKSGVF